MKSTKILEPAEGAYPYPLLIKQLLLSGPRYAPEQEIHYADRSSYRYTDLVERIYRLANALKAAGVGPGDTVAVLDWDTPRYLECFFAIPMMGAVLHTVNVRLAPEQVLYTINHAEDDLILVHDDFLPILEAVQGEMGKVRGYIQLTDQAQPKKTSLPIIGEYESLLAEADSLYDFPDFDENSVATTFYTTGTTGNPKGVYFSHRQLVLHTLAVATTLGAFEELPLMRSDSVYMPITPMFHVHAWGVPYVATMLGAKQIYPGRYDPELLVQLITRHGVTFSHCVPTVMQMMLGTEAIKRADLSQWRVLIGGSALTRALCEAGAKLGISIYSGYGMSETCPILATTHLKPEEMALPLEQQVGRRIMTGVGAPLVQLEIVNDMGSPLPHDGQAQGELVTRAPWLTQSYLKDPESGAGLWRKGWLHTGDVATIDSDENLMIRDRIKDVIKTDGEWVSSLELENLISQHPDVAAVAVVGMADRKWGERPHALVVRKPGSEVGLAELRGHLLRFVEKGKLSKWAVPEEVDFVEDIPKTSVGKINKKLIRERLQER